MSSLVITVDDGSFEQEVVQSALPVLLEFWATWCGPCKMVAPILEDIASLYQGRLKVVKIDIDHNEKTTAKYAVRSVPTMILFKKGEIVDTKLGAMAQSQLVSFIDSHL
ncbi:MAG: thioredoxin [Neisseriales bacterium]|nr:MAG: thioredoxin [Neisseriales bacterium]